MPLPGRDTEPPAKPPAPELPPDPWAALCPMLFTAWAFEHPADAPWTVTELRQRCLSAGVKSVALQLGHFNREPDALRNAGGLGVRVVLWGIASPADDVLLERWKPDAYVPQVEGPAQRDEAIANLRDGIGADTLRGIVTNFASLEATPQVQVVNSYTTATLVEVYLAAHVPNVPAMMWQATQYGLRNPIPVVGLYGGFKLSDYDLSGIGRRFAVWYAEQLTDEDWQAIGDAPA